MWCTWVIFASKAVFSVARDGSTFNDAECTDPAPIDGALYQSINMNVHRPTNIEGYCGGIAAGKVRVGFSLGNCKVPFNTNGDAFTGSNQANRIIIEEVEPPVA